MRSMRFRCQRRRPRTPLPVVRGTIRAIVPVLAGAFASVWLTSAATADPVSSHDGSDTMTVSLPPVSARPPAGAGSNGHGSPLAQLGDAVERQRVLARVGDDRLLDRLYAERMLLLDEAGETDSVEGLVIFLQPPDRTFELLSQSGRQSEFRPELRRVHTVRRFDGGTVDEHHLRIMFLDFGYRLRHTVEPRLARIRWQLDPGFDNDLEHLTGSWQIFDLDDERSLGLFGTEVRVGAALPAFLQKQVTRKNVPKTLRRCRQWVDSGGRWRP